jgi:HD-GYP domain-containing protein (c-di-GMP phosphodiesterase class II)
MITTDLAYEVLPHNNKISPLGYKLKNFYEPKNMKLNQTIALHLKKLENIDFSTSAHSKNVARIACKIAFIMNLPKPMVKNIYYAALLHDYGKIIIPLNILNKTNTLSQDEMDILKHHPVFGHQLLMDALPPTITNIILQHHERIDGSGYPNALIGKEILIEAKIIAVADVIIAMSSNRPYRKALSHQSMLEEIIKYRGKKYEPNVVDCVLEHIF